VLAVGSGSLNFADFRKDGPFDLIPVDVNANQIIASSAYKGFIYEQDKEQALRDVEIYHNSSSMTNPITFDNHRKMMLDTYNKFSLKRKLAPVNFKYVDSKFET